MKATTDSMGLGQYDSLGEYCGLPLGCFLILLPNCIHVYAIIMQ